MTTRSSGSRRVSLKNPSRLARRSSSSSPCPRRRPQRHVQVQAAAGEQLHVRHEGARVEMGEPRPAPARGAVAPEANAAHPRVGGVMRQLAGELGGSRLQARHQRLHERITVRFLQHPAVVGDALAGLHHDHAVHPLRPGHGAAVRAQRAAVDGRVARRPRHPLGAGGIVEMDVGVDDHGRSFRPAGSAGAARWRRGSAPARAGPRRRAGALPASAGRWWRTRRGAPAAPCRPATRGAGSG